MDWDGFTDWLMVEYDLGPKTIYRYRRVLGMVLAWCAEQDLCLDELTPRQIRAYADSTPNANSSRTHLRTTLARYFEWRGLDDRRARAVKVPPRPQWMCKALEVDEARVVVKTALGWWPQGTAVLLGLYLALRASEIAAARWDRFDGAREWYTVTGKFDKTAEVPVHPVLRAELAETAVREGPWLFPGSRGRAHVTYQSVWNWTREVCDSAGVGLIAPHRLRHTAGATGNDNTGDIRSVQTFMRHSDVATTSIYTRTKAHKLRQVSDALDYL